MIPVRGSSRNRLLFTGLLVFVAVAAAVGGALWLRHRWLGEVGRIRAELAPFVIAPVTVRGEIYTIEDLATGSKRSLARDRAALRLARYALLTRIDPVFALSGVDTVKLRDAVKTLQWSIDQLLASPFLPPEQRWLVEDFQPVRFLSALPGLEERRRAFIAAPTLEAAEAYQSDLERTASFVRELLTNLKATVRRAAAPYQQEQGAMDGRMPDIAFLRTVSDVERFLAALDEIGDGFRQQQRKLRERGGCLALLRPCRGPVAFGWQLNGQLFDQWTNVTASPINRAAAEIIRAHWERQGIKPGERVIRVGTECFGMRAASHPFAPFHFVPQQVGYLAPGWEGPELGEVFEPNPLGDLYFANLGSSSPAAQAVHPPASAADLWIFWQPAANFYTCPDLGYLGRLSTYVRILDDLERQPLFRSGIPLPGDSAAWLRELGEIESALVRSVDVTESEVLAFVHRVASALGEHGERALAAAVGTERAERSVELVQQVLQGSAALDTLLNAGALQNYHFERRWFPPRFSIPPLLTAMSRSSPSLYFLPFNYAFVPDGPPVFAKDVLAFPGHPYIGLARAAEKYTPGEIVRIMARSVAYSAQDADAR